MRHIVFIRYHGPERLPNKDSPVPAIDIVDNSLPYQLVLADLGQQLRPDEPVHPAGEDDAEPDDAVDPVGQGLVYVLALLGRHEGGDDEVDVAEHEEYDDGQGRAEGRVPVPLVPLDVEPGKAGSDEGVDNGQRVGDKAGKIRLAFLTCNHGAVIWGLT